MVCKRAMEVAPFDAIYNATDGAPSTMADYFNQVADFAGLPRPPQVSMEQAQAAMSAGMLSYLQESRRIGNSKLLSELGLVCNTPSTADALASAPSRQRFDRWQVSTNAGTILLANPLIDLWNNPLLLLGSRFNSSVCAPLYGQLHKTSGGVNVPGCADGNE